MRLERPIIVLGAARSGTTLLSHLLARHPHVAYWEEPVHIWRHRHAYRRDDVLDAADATPAVTRQIRKQFEKFLVQSGRKRFVEKTPSNCFRVPFIRQVFPDALYVHMIRDGRAATVSAMGQWMNDMTVRRAPESSALVMNTSYTNEEGDGLVARVSEAGYVIRTFVRDKRRFAGGIWAFLDAPAQVPSLIRVIARKLTRDRSFLWGPRFPGMAAFHRQHTLLETCALQWATSVQAVRLATEDMRADQIFELRYEELLADPEVALRRLCDFAGLAWMEPMTAAAGSLHPGDNERWRRALTPAQVDLLEARLGPLLTELGYPRAHA